MAAYLIANIKVTNDAWVADYAAHAHELVHKHGGHYLSRSANITPVEGEKPDWTIVAMIRFPDSAAAESFLRDPAYAPYAAARQAGSVSQFYLVDDTDVAGTIDYLVKSVAASA